MSVQQTVNSPTEPGPFQKYLFSGACYVQIGQCYALVKQAASQDKQLTDDDQLKASLVEVWNSFVTNRFGEFSSLECDEWNADVDTRQWHWISQLHQEIQRTGVEAMQDLLPELSQIDSDQLDLKQFFLIWAKSCDHAYTRLVKSDVFARAVGEVANNMLSAVKNGRSV